MICVMCRQAETLDGLTSVRFERDEMRLTVHNVPGQICPHCTEAYLEEEVAVHLLRQAGSFSEAGILDAESDYRRAPT